jgi:hypothetical protein
MEWQPPEWEEICMAAEIGAYQPDDGERPEFVQPEEITSEAAQ